MIRIFPDGKSKPVSALALGLAVVCGFLAAQAISDLSLMLSLYSSPAFRISMSSSTVPVEMPPLAAFVSDHMRIFFSVMALLWLSGFILALGIWRRGEWARRGAVPMLYLLSAASFLAMIFPSLIIPSPLMYAGVSIAPKFNEAVRTAALYLRIISVTCGSLFLWWALALDRGAARLEFVPKVKK